MKYELTNANFLCKFEGNFLYEWPDVFKIIKPALSLWFKYKWMEILEFFGEGGWRFLGTKRLTYTWVNMVVFCFLFFQLDSHCSLMYTLPINSFMYSTILKVWVWFTAVALYSTHLQELCIARLVSFLLHVHL